MEWKSHYLFGIAVLVAVAALAVFLNYPRRPLYKDSNEAFFSRPTTIDASTSQNFSIRLNGIDWLKNTPEVRCGQECELDVTLPPRENDLVARNVLVAPRKPEDGPEAFEWIDLHCDWFTDQRSRPGDPEMTHPIFENETVKIAPGEYVVRIYLQTLSLDLEQEKLPNNVLVGETKLRVLPSEDGSECGLIPLADKKQKMPAFVSD